MLEPRPEIRMATRLRVIPSVCAPLRPLSRSGMMYLASPRSYVGIRGGAMPRGRSARRLASCLRGSIAMSDLCRGRRLNIPNLITLARILSVPIMVWAIATGEMLFAFALFVLAGLSDAVDGYLAKRLDMASELGAYLDPIADKALIVSIYVTLGISGAV